MYLADFYSLLGSANQENYLTDFCTFLYSGFLTISEDFRCFTKISLIYRTTKEKYITYRVILINYKISFNNIALSSLIFFIYYSMINH